MKWSNKIFKLIVILPIFWWIYQVFFGDLGVEPAKEMNHNTGLIALIYLVFNLWIGIIFAFWKKPPAQLRFLLQERRFLGILTYFILIAHVSFYFALESFGPQALNQIFEKTYLIFGSFAFLGMTILALTSNNFSVRKLTGKKWKLLHRIVYFVTVLVTVHIFLIEKADLMQFTLITLPMWLGEFARLLRWRIQKRKLSA